MLNSLKKCSALANSVLASFCGGLMAIIAILMVIDMVGRTMRRPVHAVGELAVFVLVGAAYMGLAQCEETKTHVRIDSFILLLSPKGQKFLNVFSYIIALISVVILFYAITLNLISSFQTGEAVAGTVPLPVYPVKVVMFFGVAAYAVQIFINFLECFRQGKGTI